MLIPILSFLLSLIWFSVTFNVACLGYWFAPQATPEPDCGFCTPIHFRWHSIDIWCPNEWLDWIDINYNQTEKLMMKTNSKAKQTTTLFFVRAGNLYGILFSMETKLNSITNNVDDDEQSIVCWMAINKLIINLDNKQSPWQPSQNNNNNI